MRKMRLPFIDTKTVICYIEVPFKAGLTVFDELIKYNNNKIRNK